MSQQLPAGAETSVLYVDKRNAKVVKNRLEELKWLDKCYRMTPAPAADQNTIAIPITEWDEVEMKDFVEETGHQWCRYSSAVLGSSRTPSKLHDGLTPLQQALVNVINDCTKGSAQRQTIIESVSLLNTDICPKKLEVIGDDKTVVLPRTALSLENSEFRSMLLRYIVPSSDDVSQEAELNHVLLKLWEELVRIRESPRIVRRGDIDPESRVRESGHRILWPDCGSADGVPVETGPGSPGWITVTEQGIKQSFDMTRVMFSRGNISEKIRFGRLVQKGEKVLDMYTGIGYYTLPALVHGGAKHVYACEWNQNAVEALQYNLSANGIDNSRATVLQGDSRVLVSEHQLFGIMDRVSLGLLPSSEGGWHVAVKALNKERGGWLHVHGNVPESERDSWIAWLCNCLLQIADDISRCSWTVVCHHVEKVKSFAPKVFHFVADVHLGPQEVRLQKNETNCRAFVLDSDGHFVPCSSNTPPPSCALSPGGVLHQKWMM